MANYLEVCVWLLEQKHKALALALKEKGTTMEEKLLGKLEEIYQHEVSPEQRAIIEAEVEAQAKKEEEEAAKWKAENYRVTVFQIIGNSGESYWRCEREISSLHLARELRKALRQKDDDPILVLKQALKADDGACEDFLQQRYVKLCGNRFISNVFVLDFEQQVASIVVPDKGIVSYRMKDISTAVYGADRKKGEREEAVAVRFRQLIEGKNCGFVPWKKPDWEDNG